MADFFQSGKEIKHSEADQGMFVTQGLHFSLFQIMPPFKTVLLNAELTSGLRN